MNNLDRSRWHLENVLWFGGYNSKTGRENNFGFLLSENGNELFLHKDEISRSYTPVGDTLVLLREGIGKNGEPTAFNAHIPDKANGERAELLIGYLWAAIEEGVDFIRWRYRDYVVNSLIQSFDERAIIRLVTSDIAATEVLPLSIKSCNYDKQFAFFASDRNFDDLTTQQTSPAVMPSLSIDNDIDQFAIWVESYSVATDRQGTSTPDIINELLSRTSTNAILYLAFYDCINGERTLEYRHDDIENFVRRSFTKNKTDIQSFVRDAYQ